MRGLPLVRGTTGTRVQQRPRQGRGLAYGQAAPVDKWRRSHVYSCGHVRGAAWPQAGCHSEGDKWRQV